MSCLISVFLLNHPPGREAHQSQEEVAPSPYRNAFQMWTTADALRVTHSDPLAEMRGLLARCYDCQMSLSSQLWRASSVFAEENCPIQIASPLGAASVLMT